MLHRIVSNLTSSPPSTMPTVHGDERRRALRVDWPFPALVRGTTGTGDRFTVTATLENLSACGLYLRLRQPIEPGAALFAVVQLALSAGQASAPSVAVRGTVARVDAPLDGRYGVAVAFHRHRFLYVKAL